MPSTAGNQVKMGPVDTVILAMPGTLPTTVAGRMDVFTQAGQLWKRLCAANPAADIGERQAWANTVVPHLVRLHGQGARIASICTGAFVLAQHREHRG